MDTFSLIIGTVACISMVLGYLPQAIITIMKRNTEGISLMAWSLMAVGSVCFVIQGFVNGNYPLVITNLITGVCSLCIVFIKIVNEREKKHRCHNNNH